MTVYKIDARGLICPLPILKARKKLLSMTAGDELLIEVTDKNSSADMARFCADQGYEYIGMTDQSGIMTLIVRIKNQ